MHNQGIHLLPTEVTFTPASTLPLLVEYFSKLDSHSGAGGAWAEGRGEGGVAGSPLALQVCPKDISRTKHSKSLPFEVFFF